MAAAIRDQGAYRADLTVWTYPYVSVFNEEEIYQYRDVPQESLSTEGPQPAAAGQRQA